MTHETTAQRVAHTLNNRTYEGVWFDVIDYADPTNPIGDEFGSSPGDRAEFGDGSAIEYHPGPLRWRLGSRADDRPCRP